MPLLACAASAGHKAAESSDCCFIGCLPRRVWALADRQSQRAGIQPGIGVPAGAVLQVGQSQTAGRDRSGNRAVMLRRAGPTVARHDLPGPTIYRLERRVTLARPARPKHTLPSHTLAKQDSGIRGRNCLTVHCRSYNGSTTFEFPSGHQRLTAYHVRAMRACSRLIWRATLRRGRVLSAIDLRET